MSTVIEIGAYDAKTHFPEYLRKVQSGMSFRITNRGEHVADLVPPGTTEKRSGAEAAARMQQFVRTQSPTRDVDIKALIEEGRD
ncbi:MAG: type II toxin-antitoxin system prevent-host-death family antitoxin [Propionivibrio sp.]